MYELYYSEIQASERGVYEIVNDQGDVIPFTDISTNGVKPAFADAYFVDDVVSFVGARLVMAGKNPVTVEEYDPMSSVFNSVNTVGFGPFILCPMPEPSDLSLLSLDDVIFENRADRDMFVDLVKGDRSMDFDTSAVPEPSDFMSEPLSPIVFLSLSSRRRPTLDLDLDLDSETPNDGPDLDDFTP